MPVLDMPIEQLKEYKGTNPCPKDFDEFWDRGIQEMKGLNPAIELIPSEFQVPFAECFDMYFSGVKGARIHAKYLRPKNCSGKHPAILFFHGYSSNCGDWNDKLSYVALGYSVFALDCRGQGGLSEDVGGIKGNTFHGHIVRGLSDKPENLLMRDIFLDTAQLAGIAMKMPEADENQVFALGGSQGGALSIACSALEPRISRIVSVYPFLSDYRRIWDMDMDKDCYDELRQYFRLFDPLHKKEDEAFEKLGYIDVHNLAPRIKGKVLFVTGLMDNICPPSTQFAVYNNITASKELFIYPDFGHEFLPGANDLAMQHLIKK